MLINLRNALMAGKRLPYDAELEYLESTGTQWIDTGVEGNSLTKIDLTASGNRRNRAWLGCGTSSSFGDRLLLCTSTSGSITVTCRFDGTIVTTNVHCEDVTVIESDIANQMLTANGVETQIPFSGGISDRPVYLFAANYGGPSLVSNGHRIYSVKFYTHSGVLVRDYIPVRKGTVGYLYDRVSGKLFGNAGTGDFTCGPDVVPVEWLESHRTEWIDTGIVPTAADSFYCRIKQNVIRDQCLWGLAGVAYAFSNYSAASLASNGTYWGHPAIGQGGVNGVNPLGDANWHEILCQPSGIFVDGVQINTQVTGPAQPPKNSVALFARAVNSAGGGVAKNGQGRMSAFRIERNDDPVCKMLPVRVGTEGAMMDILTRRIYRNAGTGAFTYGNDLKYPIPAS